jgi:hypothetical protein
MLAPRPLPDKLQCIAGSCVATGAPDDAVTAFDALPADTPRADAASFAVRIDIAGPAHTGIDYAGNWSADPGPGGICNGTPFTSPTMGINGTNDAALFVNQMFNGKLSCTIPNVPAGTYRPVTRSARRSRSR